MPLPLQFEFVNVDCGLHYAIHVRMHVLVDLDVRKQQIHLYFKVFHQTLKYIYNYCLHIALYCRGAKGIKKLHVFLACTLCI